MDIYAFRVIVNDSDICYRVLGQMHSRLRRCVCRRERLYRHSANGYQSSNTRMIAPHGVPVEVRSVPKDMDQMAEMGVAAHWAYVL